MASPASSSPMDEYTGEREMESSRLTSRTLACQKSKHQSQKKTC